MILNYLSCSKENNIRVNTFILSLLLLHPSFSPQKARSARESNNIGDNEESQYAAINSKPWNRKSRLDWGFRLAQSTRESRFPKTWIHRSDRWMPRMGRGKKSLICDAIFPAKFLADRAETSTPFRVWNWEKKQRGDFKTFENRRMMWKDKEIFGMNGFKKIELDSLFYDFDRNIVTTSEI